MEADDCVDCKAIFLGRSPDYKFWEVGDSDQVKQGHENSVEGAIVVNVELVCVLDLLAVPVSNDP